MNEDTRPINPDGSPPLPMPPPLPSQRGGCLTALMAISGIILLLPGLCALLFGGLSIFDRSQIAFDIAPLIILGLLVGAGGVALIWAAFRGRRG